MGIESVIIAISLYEEASGSILDLRNGRTHHGMSIISDIEDIVENCKYLMVWMSSNV